MKNDTIGAIAVILALVAISYLWSLTGILETREQQSVREWRSHHPGWEPYPLDSDGHGVQD